MGVTISSHLFTTALLTLLLLALLHVLFYFLRSKTSPLPTFSLLLPPKQNVTITNLLSSSHYQSFSVSEALQPSSASVPLRQVSSANNIKVATKQEKKRSSSRRVEDGLERARAAIREAVRSKNYSSYKKKIYIPTGVVYRNPVAFHQSHIEMEKRFKVWVYRKERSHWFTQHHCMK